MTHARDGMSVQIGHNLIFNSAAETVSKFPNIREEMFQGFKTGTSATPRHWLAVDDREPEHVRF